MICEREAIIANDQVLEFIRRNHQHYIINNIATVSRGVWESPEEAMNAAMKELQQGALEEEKVKFLQLRSYH